MPDLPDRNSPDAESAHLSYPGLVLPVATSIAILTIVFFLAGGDAAVELLTTAIATATVAGKFVVLRGLHHEGFLDSPYKLALLVIYLDLMVAMIAVYNIGVFFKIPKFGAKIRAMQDNGKRILERNPWMGKLTFLGVIAFVMFPLSGTGAIGGSIVGRMLGLSKTKTILGIAIGAVSGAFAMAWLADVFGEGLRRFQDNPITLVGGIVVIGGAVWLMVRNSRRAAKRRRDLRVAEVDLPSSENPAGASLDGEREESP